MPKEDSNVSWTIMKEIVFGCCDYYCFPAFNGDGTQIGIMYILSDSVVYSL